MDSGPPPRCDFEEVEPNDLPDSAQALPMEEWACGGFDRYLDTDWFTITPTQTGWVSIQVEAAKRATSANPQLLIDADGDSALVLDGYLTTDPRLVFPSPAIEPYRVTLAETDLLYGDDYGWYMLASLTKAPVVWDFDEAEPNDTFGAAQPFTLGQTVFGTIGAAGDFDWYKITTTEATSLNFNVVAFTEGSAVDLTLYLYDSDGTTLLREDQAGEIDADPDPYFDFKVSDAKDMYLLARNTSDRGGRFYWYTLTITSTPTQ